MSASPGYFELPRSEVVPFLPASYHRVLEVGCGSGVFRGALGAPHEYWGIEPNPGAAEVARTRLDRVLVGRFDAVAGELPDGYFDLVIANDVIEHMEDPGSFLDRIPGAMAPGGVLVASVPNVRFVIHLHELLFGRDWEYRDEGILDRTHLRFFTEKSLRRLLARHGWTIERFAGINRTPTWPPRPRLLAKRALIALLGADTAYLQFGFRARPGAPRSP